MYKCEIIADSLSPQGNRLTTYKVTYPRIIHAEMCRHRILSRNSASSRAIPFKRMVQMVEEDPFIPIAWQKNHKGMQGTEYHDGVIGQMLEEGWLQASKYAIHEANRLNVNLLTKQLCNRLLEPFLWHTEIITGTEWDNFFDLRCPKYSWQGEGSFKSWKDLIKSHFDNGASRNWVDSLENTDILTKLINNSSQAEIHIQAIAEMMWDAMNKSTPKQLQAGEWHIPMGDNFDEMQLALLTDSIKNVYRVQEGISDYKDTQIEFTNLKVKIATARCARTSYKTLGDNPKIDYEVDIDLHDDLRINKHWSPFEHCAKAMNNDQYYDFRKGIVLPGDEDTLDDNTLGWCNNFKGFIQYRYLLENK